MDRKAFRSGSKMLLLTGTLLAFVLLAACTAGTDAAGYSEESKTAAAESGTGAAESAAGPGVIVTAVTQGSPAEEGGITRGDILLSLDGQAISSPLDVTSILEDTEPGSRITVGVLHGDEQRSLGIETGEQNGMSWLGISICCTAAGEFPLHMLRSFPLQGALVLEVIEDSPADIGGLQPGDLIHSVNSVPLESSSDLAAKIQALEAGDTVTLAVTSTTGEDEKELTIELAADPHDETRPYLGIRYQQFTDSETGHFMGMDTAEGRLELLMERNLLLEDGYFSRLVSAADDHMPSPWPGQVFQMPEKLPAEAVDGVLLTDVFTDSPADESGLLPGDVLLSVEGKTVHEKQQASRRIHSHKPGETITLEIYRSGVNDRISLDVTLAEDPDSKGKPYLGVELGPSLHLPSAREGLWLDTDERRTGCVFPDLPLNLEPEFDTILQERQSIDV